MKKKIIEKTYGIRGIVSKSVLLECKGKKVRIEFSGGSINTAGIRPAKYRTSDPDIQKAIESDRRFKGIEVSQSAAETEEDDCSEKDNENSGTEQVTETHVEAKNFQQARNILASEYGVPISDMPNKDAVMSKAKQLGVTFENLK